MRVRLDLPIFASPTDAWGCANGYVDIPSLPPDGGWFDLPMKSEELNRLGMPYPTLVWSTVTFEDESKGILLDGVVANGPEDAARIAQILEEQFDFFIDEYDHAPIPLQELSAALEAAGASGWRPTSDAWLSNYGRLRDATVLSVRSEASNLWIGIDDHWASRRGDYPAEPGSLLLLSADRSAADLGSIVGKRVKDSRMVETQSLEIEFVDHETVALHASYIVWAPGHPVRAGGA